MLNAISESKNTFVFFTPTVNPAYVAKSTLGSWTVILSNIACIISPALRLSVISIPLKFMLNGNDSVLSSFLKFSIFKLAYKSDWFRRSISFFNLSIRMMTLSRFSGRLFCKSISNLYLLLLKLRFNNCNLLTSASTSIFSFIRGFPDATAFISA